MFTWREQNHIIYWSQVYLSTPLLLLPNDQIYSIYTVPFKKYVSGSFTIRLRFIYKWFMIRFRFSLTVTDVQLSLIIWLLLGYREFYPYNQCFLLIGLLHTNFNMILWYALYWLFISLKIIHKQLRISVPARSVIILCCIYQYFSLVVQLPLFRNDKSRIRIFQGFVVVLIYSLQFMMMTTMMSDSLSYYHQYSYYLFHSYRWFPKNQTNHFRVSYNRFEFKTRNIIRKVIGRKETYLKMTTFTE